MGRGKALDETTKAIIFSLKEEGRSANEIAEAVGRTPHTIRELLRRAKNGEIRVCESCGKKILTEKDRVMEHLNDIGKCIGEFPNSFRDRIMANVHEVRKYIKGH